MMNEIEKLKIHIMSEGISLDDATKNEIINKFTYFSHSIYLSSSISGASFPTRNAIFK